MILQPPPVDDVSFVAAQTAAREWADKALDFGQAGDTEQARYASFRAEASLVKMLAIEAQERRLKNDKLPIARSRARRPSPPHERRQAKLNNAALRTWPRSLLHLASPPVGDTHPRSLGGNAQISADRGHR
jgi:hypothetical protein